MFRPWAVLTAVLLSSAASLPAATDAPDPSAWRFDPARSHIHFQLSAMGIMAIEGSFERFTGEVRRADDGSLRVDMRIDAGSLTMESQRYRDWARSKEFFDVRRHPQIAFESGPVAESLLIGGGQLAGMLQLRGVRREVTFNVLPGRCSSTGQRCELRVSGEINRRQFGMRTRRLTLSNRVALDMRFVAVVAAADQPHATGDQPSND